MDVAPVMIWVSGIDKQCVWFNQPWLRFTGRDMRQEVINGWTEGVHAEDFDRCLETYVSHFDARKEFRMEYRLRRHDGTYRWIDDTGSCATRRMAPFLDISVPVPTFMITGKPRANYAVAFEIARLTRRPGRGGDSVAVRT